MASKHFKYISELSKSDDGVMRFRSARNICPGPRSLRIATNEVHELPGQKGGVLSHFTRKWGNGEVKGEKKNEARSLPATGERRLFITGMLIYVPPPSIEEMHLGGRRSPGRKVPDAKNRKRGAISLLAAVGPSAGFYTPRSQYSLSNPAVSSDCLILRK